MHPIPYGRQSIDDDDIREVVDVLHSDYLTTGPKIQEFEDSLCDYCGCNHAVAVNSGTSALDIAIQSLGLPRGSEIITTPFTFAATSNSLLYNNLIPVYADISRDTRNIDPADVRKKITPRTRAIVFVDYAGHPCEISELQEIADEHNLLLIEDACHALGAGFQGKKIGSIADLTIFSFHPVKLITTGEGGMITTNNPTLAETLALLRSHGIDKSLHHLSESDASWAYDMVTLGRNYRMTDIQATLGLSQVRKIDAFVHRRTDLSRLYQDLLQDIPGVDIPITRNGFCHAWHIFTVLLSGVCRDEVFSFLKKHDIGVNVHYIPTYRFTYYRKTHPQDPTQFPVTEDVFKRILTLPLYPTLQEEEIVYIVDTLKKAMHTLSSW